MVVGVVAFSLAPFAAKSQVATTADSSRLFASNPPLNITHAQDRREALATYSHLPLIFEPNQGQTDAKVKYLAHGRGYGLYLTIKKLCWRCSISPLTLGIQRLEIQL